MQSSSRPEGAEPAHSQVRPGRSTLSKQTTHLPDTVTKEVQRLHGRIAQVEHDLLDHSSRQLTLNNDIGNAILQLVDIDDAVLNRLDALETAHNEDVRDLTTRINSLTNAVTREADDGSSYIPPVVVKAHLRLHGMAAMWSTSFDRANMRRLKGIAERFPVNHPLAPLPFDNIFVTNNTTIFVFHSMTDLSTFLRCWAFRPAYLHSLKATLIG